MNRHVHFSLIVALLFLHTFYAVQAQDTTVVQTFSFDTPGPGAWGAYSGEFEFPDDGQTYEKILMYHTLKCDPSTQQDNFNCGEWDYLTYTYIDDDSGEFDSTYRTQVNYTAGGATPDQFGYTADPQFDYIHEQQVAITHTETLSLNEATIGTGTNLSNTVLGTSKTHSRSQFLWRVSELTSAGLVAGDITGMRFDLAAIGSEVRNLTVSMKQTALDEITTANFETGGFTETYHLNTTFAATGWNDLQFTTPFAWDGFSNLIIELSYDNTANGSGSDNTVHAETTTFGSGVSATDNAHFLEFKGADYVEVPTDVLAQITDEVTISFWQYGDPNIQPQSDYAFEARDADNNRVLNVHLPWSDSQVYWDAGNSGTDNYDRINKAAMDTEFKGQWNHWAFVKNASMGQMRIYLNGVLWHSGGGKIRTMEGITHFRIGSHATNTNAPYDGFIDDFRIWNKALDEATVAEWMNKDLDATHPDYAHLLSYYQFNENNGLVANDASPNENHAALGGYPRWLSADASSLTRNLTTVTERPNVVFEQGEYMSEIATILSIEAIPHELYDVVLYGNDYGPVIVFDDSENHPTEATDMFTAYEAGIYSYIYDSEGILLDSTYIDTQNSLSRDDIVYYSNQVRFELGRFITPYGINLDLGPEGFRWIYDVTDYAPLLKGNVTLRSGNAQELLDLKFIMIHGTPPREVLGIKNLYSGSWSYASMLENTNAGPVTVTLPQAQSGGVTYRVKTRTTGHGFGQNWENCAEFCAKNHFLYVNGVQTFDWYLWDECSTNPVFPQGGTWVYDRAGWCPGAAVTTYDWDLTPHVSPGETVTFDYEVQNAVAAPAGNWVVQTQLVTYGTPNFSTDAAMVEVISPSLTQLHERKNPVCNQPTIKIMNRGGEALTSVLITYGVIDGLGWGVFPCYYRWEGNLAFMEETEVELPKFNWTNLDADNPVFFAELSEPNHGIDQYENNNRMESKFALPPRYNDGLSLEFRTNNAAFENSYTLKDDDGNIVYNRAGLSNNTLYEDVFTLEDGCYVLEFNDSGDDGISWWANADGDGWVRLKSPGGSIYQTFEPDYGDKIAHQFTIGYDMGYEYFGIECENTTAIEDADITNLVAVNIYPNPTKGKINVDLNFETAESADIQVYNVVGQLVHSQKLNNIVHQNIAIDLPASAGIYKIQVTTSKGQTFTESVVVID